MLSLLSDSATLSTGEMTWRTHTLLRNQILSQRSDSSATRPSDRGGKSNGSTAHGSQGSRRMFRR